MHEKSIRFSKHSTVVVFNWLSCKTKILKECNISQSRYWALKLSTLSFHLSDSLETYRASLVAHKVSIYGVSSKSKKFYKLSSFWKNFNVVLFYTLLWSHKTMILKKIFSLSCQQLRFTPTSIVFYLYSSILHNSLFPILFTH